MSIFRKISLLIFLLSILLFFVPFFESNKLYSDTDFQIQLEGFSLFCLGIIIFILSPKRKILTSKQQQSKNYWKRKRIDTIFTVIGVLFAIPVALLILIMILFPTNTSWTGVVFPFYLFILELILTIIWLVVRSRIPKEDNPLPTSSSATTKSSS